MRGQPLIQWLCFALGWLLLVYPIMRVTGSVGPEVQQERTHGHLIKTWMTIKFSHTPETVEIFDPKTRAWVSPSFDGFSCETELYLLFDEQRVEIRIKTRLPEHTTALELILEPDGMPSQSRTIWRSGDVDEAIAFPTGRRHD